MAISAPRRERSWGWSLATRGPGFDGEGRVEEEEEEGGGTTLEMAFADSTLSTETQADPT